MAKFSRLAAAASSALAASMICFAGAAPAATAAGEVVSGHGFGRDVVMGEMISPRKGSPTVYNVNVTAHTKTLLTFYYVYNKNTCAEISPGAWTINREPKNGTDTLGTYAYTATGGACAGTKYTGAALYYTWTAATGAKDRTIATWRGHGLGQHFMAYDEFIIHLTH